MTSAAEILSAGVRDVPDFPTPGIVFKDITPLLADGRLFRLAITSLTDLAARFGASKIVGIDARGFIFAAAVADRLGIGFVPMRKTGKLPWRTRRATYSLEYGESSIEVHEDSIAPGERVVLVDDLLATGGTAGAALRLLKELDADLAAALFLIELEFLGGRSQLDEVPVNSVVRYGD